MPNLLKQWLSLTVCLLRSLALCSSFSSFSSWIRWQSVNLSLSINSMLYLTCSLRVALSSGVKSSLDSMSASGSSEGANYWYTVSVVVNRYILLNVLFYFRQSAKGCCFNGLLVNYLVYSSDSLGIVTSTLEPSFIAVFFWFWFWILASSL